MNTPQPPRRSGSLWSLLLLVLAVMGASEAVSWWRDRGVAAEIAAARGSQRIVLYTTQSCVYCHKAKAWLRAHDIPWDECDVERDAACRATFEAQGAPGTPITRVGAHWRLGFDPGWVAQALRTPSPSQPKPSAASSPRP